MGIGKDFGDVVWMLGMECDGGFGWNGGVCCVAMYSVI